MGYTPKIYDPREGLELINKAIGKFDSNRFLHALHYKHYNPQQMELMAQQVAEYRLKLEHEHKSLLEFAKVFNHLFVTDNNKCFDTAFKLLRKMRCGVSEVKRIYMKFCPRFNGNRFPYSIERNKTYSVFDYSYFSNDVFQLQIFGLEDYPPCVKGLYNEICKFFYQLNLSISLCFQVLKDEEEIRKDAKYCNLLFEEFKQKVLQEMWGIITMIPSNHEELLPINNRAIASRNSFSSIEAWVPHGFHNYTVTDVKKLIIKEVLEEENRSGLTKEEIALFGNNPEKVHKIRNIIVHFDELMPHDYARTKLEGKRIAMFMKWCGPAKEEHFVSYFNKTYISNPKHLYKTIKIGAVNSAKNKLLTSDKDEIQYKEFVQQIDNLHIMPTIQQNFAC